MTKKINILFVTFFIVGKIKFASGTFASLVACLLFYFLKLFLSYKIIFFITVVIFLYALYAINNVLTSFTSKDPKEIVIDEVVGQFIPLIFISGFIMSWSYINRRIYNGLFLALLGLFSILIFGSLAKVILVHHLPFLNGYNFTHVMQTFGFFALTINLVASSI